ncbi:alkanesulfonate monooxygenase SsuD/methylene tetrahydromethanopterin reductase-like flavin-dependent oxidoreductase (luciferase family) [Streptosporangium becharense]|uniref:Alkanesulfonate monooxygenase SsuD/methylene tetrahydromethanopterin reductase-like flavin-dependent oxidoreductase (Luciferase family) n=1 Tax=Streptosporangium becharense TaxID=1816182 RepID=A0A7W9IMG9_9ACTN|nr:LLM class flavin-dependent oxidoreductase [Streptosporangium becharense]MBB2914567.1 alkanesulfonate monooxygenase SsuD/methylene tetrahydromethanopterin reductase-like flavin-dependent oxidoreductase (luciferase family) [Streptosporangium becharense]MBB5823412.1 alkanesulfonate monooxygenase SsuD/methylene tetrahydromethanopterin reductase-like flavin-dependent oxidoreductase (luciferase family) [Streptosporangium becharense]
MGENTAGDRPKLLGLGLSGDHLVALTGDPELTSRLNDAGAAFVAAGVERIDGSVPGDGVTLEPTVATTFLAPRAPDVAFLAAAAPHRDHPYNLARRIASGDHLSRGRSGLILGVRDGYAAAGPKGPEGWAGAGLTEGVPLGVETTRDAAIAVQKLWQSWPYESIVADRETRIFARAEQIVHIDHRGVFDVAGPLTVPTTPQGSPIIAWYADSVDAVAAAADVVDVVVFQPEDPDLVAAAVAALRGADDRRALFFAQLTYAHGQSLDGFLAGAEAVTALDGVDGVLVRPDRTVDAFAELLDRVVPGLGEKGLIRRSGEDLLRERLSLPQPPRLLAGARPAFPAPEPQPAL